MYNANLRPANTAAPCSEGPQSRADVTILSLALNFPTQWLQLWGPQLAALHGVYGGPFSLKLIKQKLQHPPHPDTAWAYSLGRALTFDIHNLFIFFFFVFEFYLFFYTAGSYYLSILCILVYICQSQSPSSSTTTPRSPSFPSLVSMYLFSTSVSLFLPCKLVHLYHFSRFHIYAFI